MGEPQAVKRALQLAFYTGTLTICERNGMLKTYELMARDFGWDRPPKPASASEVTAYLLDRALRAQGLVVSIRSAISMRRARPGRRLIEAGSVATNWWLSRSKAPASRSIGNARMLETAEPAAELVHILSPFDPLVIQRKRSASVLRLRPSLRGLCAEGETAVRLFRAAGAGRRRDRCRHRSQDRTRERKLLLQQWSWVGSAARRGGREDLKRRSSRNCIGSSAFNWRMNHQAEPVPPGLVAWNASQLRRHAQEQRQVDPGEISPTPQGTLSRLPPMPPTMHSSPNGRLQGRMIP